MIYPILMLNDVTEREHLVRTANFLKPVRSSLSSTQTVIPPALFQFCKSPLLDCCFQTGFNDGKSCIPNFDQGCTADVTGQQRMPTPPWHLILSSHLSGVRVAPPSILYLTFFYHDYV
jgi:hypothetical protein